MNGTRNWSHDGLEHGHQEVLSLLPVVVLLRPPFPLRRWRGSRPTVLIRS